LKLNIKNALQQASIDNVAILAVTRASVVSSSSAKSEI